MDRSSIFNFRKKFTLQLDSSDFLREPQKFDKISSILDVCLLKSMKIRRFLKNVCGLLRISELFFAYLRHATKTAEQSPRKSSPAVAKISVIQGWSAKPDEDVDLIEGCNRKIRENDASYLSPRQFDKFLI